ncbi:MAG: hypothetical protein FMNOHCHN_02028 [Ignavibacteriaceae bacterium]|nr:hypothetical protein [Ignavibacteriaceae bacterium]
MKNYEKELELLLEILKIHKKFGSGTFNGLITLLNDKEMLKKYENILTSIDKLSNKKKSDELNRKKISIKEKLIQIATSDKRRGDLLYLFYDKLMAKEWFPTQKQLVGFGVEAGVILKGKSRDKNVSKIMETLLLLPESQLLELKARFEVSSENDRSLENWSDIIFDKNSFKKHNSTI